MNELSTSRPGSLDLRQRLDIILRGLLSAIKQSLREGDQVTSIGVYYNDAESGRRNRHHWDTRLDIVRNGEPREFSTYSSVSCRMLPGLTRDAAIEFADEARESLLNLMNDVAEE